MKLTLLNDDAGVAEVTAGALGLHPQYAPEWLERVDA